MGVAITQAAGFEKTMSGVTAVMSPADVNTFGKSLENLALRLGKETSFSAREAAAGIEELVKGGLTATDILDGAAESTLALAAAGGVSLPDAATIAANALAQFSLKGEDMAHVADLIAGAANASAIDVGQFKFSLQAAGAVAATVGFDFDDLATGIAVMGKAGIAGSDAGTSLKTMMLNLQPTTKAQIAEFRRLGITGLDSAKATEMLSEKIAGNEAAQKSWAKHVKAGTDTLDNLYKLAQDFDPTMQGKEMDAWAASVGILGNQFFDASGKVKSMADVAGILQGATEDMTDAQRLASLEILFGSDAIRAAAILSKEGAAGFNEMAEAMGQVTAADVAAKRLDNLNGSIEQMQGSMETAGIVLGQQLIPLLRPLVDGVTGIINAFLGLNPNLQKFIAIGLVVATAIGAITTVALTLLAVLPAVISGFAAAATIAGVVGAVLTGPLLLAIGLVVGAIALLALAWNNNWGDIQGKTAAVWDFLSEQVFAPIAEALAAFGAVFLPEFAAAWGAAATKVQEVWAALVAYLTPALEAFAAWWVQNWDAIQAVLQVVWDAMALLVGTAWDAVSTLILVGLDVLQGDWEGAWERITGFLERTWEGIKRVVRDALGVTQTVTEQALGHLEREWGAGWDRIGAALRDAWQAIKDWTAASLQQLLEWIVGFGGRAWDAARGAGDLLVAGLKRGFTDAISGFRSAVEDAITGILDWIKDTVSNFKPPSVPMPSITGVAQAAASAGASAAGALSAPLRPGGKPGETASEVANFLANQAKAGKGGGDLPPEGAWLRPASGSVTQEYGRTAFSLANPGIYPNGIHTGVDLGAAMGAQVVAAQAGRVASAGWDTSGYGNLVRIAHEGGVSSLYAHLSGFATAAGASVRAGEPIGRVGSTGKSTGAHLHFELQRSGLHFNPRQLVGLMRGALDVGAGAYLVGEAGPEVVALPAHSSVLANPRLAPVGGGGGVNVTLNLNGTVLGADARRLAEQLAGEVHAALRRRQERTGGLGFA